MVQQRSEAGPGLFVHAVAFVQDADSSAQHRCHHGRCVVSDLAAFGQNGSDQKVFRTSIGGALIDVQLLPTLPRSGDRKSGLADAGRSNQSRGERQVTRVNNQPAGKQLFQDFPLADPFSFGGVGSSEMQRNTVNRMNSAHESWCCL